MLVLSFLLCFRARLFINVLWSPAGKDLASWFSFVMSNCGFPIGILCQVWCLIASIPDLCPLSYYQYIDPFKPNGFSLDYQLDNSVFILRIVGWYFSLLF